LDAAGQAADRQHGCRLGPPAGSEFALANLGIPSPYLSWAFPNHGPVNDEYLDLASLSAADRETLEADAQQLSFIAWPRSGTDEWCSSRPRTRLACGRCWRSFPTLGLSISCAIRLAIFPSTVRLWTRLCQTQGLQSVEGAPAWVEPQILETFVRMYERFEPRPGTDS